MPRVGFEPAIQVFERAKTFRALHGAATVPGGNLIFLQFGVAVSSWNFHWVTSYPIRVRGFPLSFGEMNAIIG
jgi:hypothetical protein